MTQEKESLSDHILRVRERLSDMEKEREQLSGEDFARKAELLDEEHTLQARLAELQDEAAAAGVGVAEEKVSEATDPDDVPDTPSEVVSA